MGRGHGLRLPFVGAGAPVSFPLSYYLLFSDILMSKFESSIKQIPYSQQAVYAMLSDLGNIEKVRDRIPEDKIRDFRFGRRTAPADSGTRRTEVHKVCHRAVAHTV